MKLKNSNIHPVKNNNLLVATNNTNTKMSKRTDDTFSDRVQKINKNNSNQRSTLASKETNRTKIPLPTSKVTQATA